MTVKMEATFQNGGHENIKKCIYIYISCFGGFLCAIHTLIGFLRSKNSLLILSNSK